jgi:ABC-2 type transport system permease protein
MKALKKNSIDLLRELVKTNFKLRYNNSVLGVLWVLIKPYSTFLVMYYIWSRLGGETVPNYRLYLLVGIVTNAFFQEQISSGLTSLLDTAHIILKVNFPRQLAVMSASFGALINLGINLLLIAVIGAFTNLRPTPLGVAYIFLIYLIMYIFCLSISFVSSIILIRFRDLKNITDLGLFLLYWATPIFYVLTPNIAQGSTMSLIAANPLGILINQVRAGLGIYGEVNWQLMLIYLAVGLVSLVLSWTFFQKNVKKVAEYF